MCVCPCSTTFCFLVRKLTDRQRELLEEFVATEDVNGSVNKRNKTGAEVNSMPSEYPLHAAMATT